jgi:hypothetical protein
MIEAHYPTWSIALSEQLVEAVTARMLRRELGPWASEDVLVLADENRGYSHVEPLARALVAYERRRDRYPDLASFLPEALAALRRAEGRPRWYGGADGIDQSAGETMLKRIIRAASRQDASLIDGYVAEGANRLGLVYHVSRVLPQELGLAPGGAELSARLRTVRRMDRPGLNTLESADPAGIGDKVLKITAELEADAGGRPRRALLRFTMEPDPPRRLLSVGTKVYHGRLTRPQEDASEP